MPATEFSLATDWRLPAPVADVWALIVAPEDWPSWWRAVKRVELLAAGDEAGRGAIRRMTWRTALPYKLTFDMRTSRVEPMRLIEGIAEGELDGTGKWTFLDRGDATDLRYEWNVQVTQPWMRVIAPLARPVFAWNHSVVMGWGLEGITQRLGRDG